MSGCSHNDIKMKNCFLFYLKKIFFIVLKFFETYMINMIFFGGGGFYALNDALN